MPNYLREVRNLITGNSDKQAHEAAEKKDGNMTDAPLGRDDSAWGLDVLVEGADPVVEYVSSYYYNSMMALVMMNANYRAIILVSLQSTGSKVIERQPGQLTT